MPPFFNSRPKSVTRISMFWTQAKRRYLNFNLSFEYRMYANRIRIRILKSKFENLNLVLHPYSHLPVFTACHQMILQQTDTWCVSSQQQQLLYFGVCLTTMVKMHSSLKCFGVKSFTRVNMREVGCWIPSASVSSCLIHCYYVVLLVACFFSDRMSFTSGFCSHYML